MTKQQTWYSVKELRDRWRVSRAWIKRQCRARRLSYVQTVDGALFHRDTVLAFEREHAVKLYTGQVEQEVDEIRETQLQLDLFNIGHTPSTS